MGDGIVLLCVCVSVSLCVFQGRDTYCSLIKMFPEGKEGGFIPVYGAVKRIVRMQSGTLNTKREDISHLSDSERVCTGLR